MTKKEKQLTIACVIIAAIILWLLLRKQVVTVAGEDTPFNIEIPAFNLPPHVGYPITIPGLPPMDPIDYPFSAISACACGSGLVPYYYQQAIAQQTYTVQPTYYTAPQQSTNFFSGIGTISGREPTSYWWDNPTGSYSMWG